MEAEPPREAVGHDGGAVSPLEAIVGTVRGAGRLRHAGQAVAVLDVEPVPVLVPVVAAVVEYVGEGIAGARSNRCVVARRAPSRQFHEHPGGHRGHILAAQPVELCRPLGQQVLAVVLGEGLHPPSAVSVAHASIP